MNIKQHIEAGHYPKDYKGRALVPMRGGGVFTVCATDKPQTLGAANEGAKPRCIVGWTAGYYLESFSADDVALLPPVPRKVKVTARLHRDTGNHWSIVHLETNAGKYLDAALNVELTGEYEEP